MNQILHSFKLPPSLLRASSWLSQIPLSIHFDSPPSSVLSHLLRFSRDDLSKTAIVKSLQYPNDFFWGNKRTKFSHLLSKETSSITHITSTGGLQSNCIVPLSIISKLKGWKFYYKIDETKTRIPTQSIGTATYNNFDRALELGMQVLSSSSASIPFDSDSGLDIPLGGSDVSCRVALHDLAEEIVYEFASTHSELGRIGVVVPSGTGTTALFMAESFDYFNAHVKRKRTTASFTVLAIACVGNADYLESQMKSILPSSSTLPACLKIMDGAGSFGTLNRKRYDLFNDLHALNSHIPSESDLSLFDLVYDPAALIALSKAKKPNIDHLIFLQAGGQSGNQSMIQRYHQKYKIG